MPAQRTPTEVLERRGSFDVHPERRRDVGPKNDRPLGPAPARLKGKQLEAWNELVAAAPAGVLTAGDRAIVELAARLLATSWRARLKGGEISQLRGCLASLGLTPADRSRVHAPTKPDAGDDDFTPTVPHHPSSPSPN